MEGMTSLWVGFWRGLNGLKGEAEEVMTSWRVYWMTNRSHVFLVKTIGVRDHKQYIMCS